MPQLASNKLCTGCSACVSICPKHCISMEKDENGFLYPDIAAPEKCINCKLCEKICPVLNNNGLNKQSGEAYAAYSLDNDIRLESSSGGIFTEIAKNVLEHEGKVYGAAYDSDFSVHHICVDKVEDLALLRGAKYSQSNLKECFNEVKRQLQNNILVLFSGTPCQVAGLKSFLQKEYDHLLCVDFLCHGIPSPMVWTKYVQYRANQDNRGIKPSKINLRSKQTGWSYYQYSNLYEYTGGIRYLSKSGEDIFMKLFIGDYINRECCSHCLFKGYERASDLTIADFWGIWDILPEMDDNQGTSAVVVHSENGKQILASISTSLKIKPVTLEQISQQNPSMLLSSKPNKKRNDILELVKDDQFYKIKDLISNNKKKRKFIALVKQKIKGILKS